MSSDALPPASADDNQSAEVKSDVPATREPTTPVKPDVSGPNLLDLASPVSSNVRIRSVSLKECDARSVAAEGSHGLGADTFRVGLQTRSANFAKHEERNQFTVFTDFILEVTSKDDPEKRSILTIQAVFALGYSVDQISNFSNENLDAFARTNGVFNAWPYWREFVQNTVVRMGFPAITIPVYRV